jgi:hypothetical protein
MGTDKKTDDDPTDGAEAQKMREKREKQDKPEGE